MCTTMKVHYRGSKNQFVEAVAPTTSIHGSLEINDFWSLVYMKPPLVKKRHLRKLFL